MNAFVEDILTRIQDLLELTPPVSITTPPLLAVSSSYTNSCISLSRKTVSRHSWPATTSSLCLRQPASSSSTARALWRGSRHWWGACWHRWWTPSACYSPNSPRRLRRSVRPPSPTAWVTPSASPGQNPSTIYLFIILSIATACYSPRHRLWHFSRTSKAFSNKQTVKQCGCTEVYRDCLQAFLPALSCPVQRSVLRSSVRSFLHRMIICMEEEVLPFVPAASEHMLKDCEAKDLQEFIPLISQITAKFKVSRRWTSTKPSCTLWLAILNKLLLLPRQRQVSPFLQQIFMPLVLAIFEVLARPAEENDQTAALEKQMLRRSYFSFIQTIAGSGMNEVMANQGERHSACQETRRHRSRVWTSQGRAHSGKGSIEGMKGKGRRENGLGKEEGKEWREKKRW